VINLKESKERNIQRKEMIIKLALIVTLMSIAVSCSTRSPMPGESVTSEAMIHERTKKSVPKEIAETAAFVLFTGVAGAAAVNSK